MISKEKLTQKLSIWGFVSWPLKKKGRKSLCLGLPPASQAGAKNVLNAEEIQVPLLLRKQGGHRSEDSTGLRLEKLGLD